MVLAAMGTQRWGFGLFGDQLDHKPNKFRPPRDPFEREADLDRMVPTDEEMNRKVLQWYQRRQREVLESGADGRQVQAELTALATWQKQAEYMRGKGQVEQDFVADFNRWLLGAGDRKDHQKTPWGRAPSWQHNDSVRTYLEQHINKRYDWRTKLYKLRHSVPDTVGQHFLYFKYIVRGEETGKDGENFMKDWDDYMEVYHTPVRFARREIVPATPDVERRLEKLQTWTRTDDKPSMLAEAVQLGEQAYYRSHRFGPDLEQWRQEGTTARQQIRPDVPEEAVLRDADEEAAVPSEAAGTVGPDIAEKLANADAAAAAATTIGNSLEEAEGRKAEFVKEMQEQYELGALDGYVEANREALRDDKRAINEFEGALNMFWTNKSVDAPAQAAATSAADVAGKSPIAATESVSPSQSPEQRLAQLQREQLQLKEQLRRARQQLVVSVVPRQLGESEASTVQGPPPLTRAELEESVSSSGVTASSASPSLSPELPTQQEIEKYSERGWWANDPDERSWGILGSKVYHESRNKTPQQRVEIYRDALEFLPVQRLQFAAAERAEKERDPSATENIEKKYREAGKRWDTLRKSFTSHAQTAMRESVRPSKISLLQSS
jgi:hypothetical protein